VDVTELQALMRAAPAIVKQGSPAAKKLVAIPPVELVQRGDRAEEAEISSRIAKSRAFAIPTILICK
jgi:hypothetical protein